MRRIPFTLLSVLLTFAVAEGATKHIKVRGYVTEIRSQNSFDIDDYRIDRDKTITLDFENDEENPSSPSPPEDIRVGTELEIKGEYDAETHMLTARSIRVFPADTSIVKRTVILENAPEIQKHGQTWEGRLRADGQTLLVDERTTVSIVPNRTQAKAEKAASKAAKNAGRKREESEPLPVPLARPGDVHTNMYVAYEGARDKTGDIHVSKIEFKDNERTPSETRLWKSVTPKVTPFKSAKPGLLRIASVGKFKTVPDQEVQLYLQKLANELLPANQRTLPDSNENKIHFQTYVIEQKSPNAFALANGTVVVHSSMFRAVENEAQLAFVLGHEMAHATQEHSIRQMEYHHKKRFAIQLAAVAAGLYGAYSVRDILNLISAAIANGYLRSLENQADRVGMEYMLAAGYDPREAPRAWKALSIKYGDSPTDFFWSSHDNNATRRSYLMAELRNNYADMDFSSKKRDSEEFHRITQLLTAQKAKKAKASLK